MRIRPRLSLKSLLLLVFILGVSFGWLGLQLNWKRDRHTEYQWIEQHENGIAASSLSARTPGALPFGLRIVGETPLDYIPVDASTMTQQDFDHLRKVQMLFPEAQVALSGTIIQGDQLNEVIELFRPHPLAGRQSME